MFFKAKNKLGLLFPIAMTFLIALFILTFSRIALSIWQSGRIIEDGAWLHILLGGLRIDISTLCYLLGVPALLSCFMPTKGKLAPVVHILFRSFIVLSIWFVVYMEIATPSFILEYDVRPNRLFVEYLIYPQEVFGMLWEGYKVELFIATLVSFSTIIGTWKLSKHFVENLISPRWFFRPLLALLVIALTIAGARSTLEHRPLNPAMVAFSTTPLLNDLALNSSYSVMFAVKQMQSEIDAFTFYPKMSDQKIIALVRSSTGFAKNKFTSDSVPTLVERKASYKGKPKNLVILLQESLGARYVGGLGGLPLTPNLDKLIKTSWSFNRMYATGTRSVRGIEAVTSGFSPTPSRAVVKLGKSQQNFFTIASVLKERGYHTQFIYGGESHFDNMKTFFLGNGFVDMQDAPTFTDPKPEFMGTWGASDGDLYVKADKQFTKYHQQGKPFFSLVFSTSNHTPYVYPKGKIEPYNSPAETRENAAKYSDYAMGEFIKKARNSAYWDDTIFVIVADHDSRAYGDQLVPIDHFRIPAIIFGGGVEPRVDNRITSQLDLPPTLLSLIGVDSKSPMIGHDMTKNVKPEKLRAMMQFYKNFAWMDNDNNVVIYQPHKAVSTYSYAPISHNLTGKKLPQSIIDVAHANALWGSLAYKKGLYPFKEHKQE